MYYSEELIEEVRSRNDIVDVISGYVRLQKKGSSYFGLCPFHNEKSPSFSVSRQKQMTSDLKKTYGYSDAEAASKATLTAYCFLLFVLLYFPCIATIAAIKGETGSWKWAGFAAGYTTLLAWVVSALVFQIGSLFI